LAGCLRNASAVAHAAAALGSTFQVCPAGERWADGSIRFALEDWLGAGAILRELSGTKSPEANAAIAAFEASRLALTDVLRACSSGRELVERGFAFDVDCASAWDVSAAVPRLTDGAYTSMKR
jgi:2-phosphosulfolactate phosphatase